MSSAVLAASILPQQIMRVAFDVQLVDAEPENQGKRTLVFSVSGLSEMLAKAKVRLYTLYLFRPKRKVVETQVEVVEHGIVLKRYVITVKTVLFGEENES